MSLRARVERTFIVARRQGADDFTQSRTLEDGSTHECSVSGVTSPEQLEDDLLTLCIWVWSLKDHLKEVFVLRGISELQICTAFL